MNETIHLNQFVVHYERKLKQKCDICNSNYRLGKSEHLCKRCLRSVCDDCAPFKVKCYMQDYKNSPHRQCRKCHLQSQVLRKYVEHHKLKFGQDSQIIRVWLKQLGLSSVPRKRNSEKKKIKQFVNFKQIWRSFNFSFREFVGIVIDQSKIPQSEFVQLINLALSELSSNRLADLQHLIYVVIFFLCHCNVYSAVYFSTLIMQILYTQEASLQNIAYFLEQMNCSEIQICKMQAIIEEFFEKIIKRCTINVFTAQISIEIMNFIISKRDFQQIQKGIAYVFNQRKQFVCANSNKPEDIILDILRNTTSGQYRKIVKAMDGSPDKSERSIGSKSDKHEQNSDSKSNRSEKKSSSSRVGQTQKLTKQNQRLKQRVKHLEQTVRDLQQQKQVIKNRSEHSSRKKQKNNADPYSTSDEASQVINKKSQQIIRLRSQIQSLKGQAEQVPGVVNTSSLVDRQQQYKKQIKQKDEIIASQKNEMQSLKNTNKKLFMKLSQLTNLLMDKQQRTLSEANRKFEQFAQELGKQVNKQQMGKQCAIF